MNIKDKVISKIKEIKETEQYKTFVSSVNDVVDSFEDEYKDIKKQIIDEIEANDTIIIVRHMRPDGDCIGSSFGLREVLRNSYPNKKIYSVGDEFGLPEYLSFLGKEDEVDSDLYRQSLVIVVDTSVEKRIANTYYKEARKVIKIDHHIRVEDYGHINYVREDFPACCQIIADLVKTSKNGLKMNEKASLCLYTGIVTDTGRFRYRSVDSKTMNIASYLLNEHIDTEKIYTSLNTKNPESFKLQGFMYQNFKLTENGVAYAFITKKIMKKFKASVEDASNLVNCLDSIKGSLIWILFVEYDNEIRVRLRSRYIPVVGIGEQFNGGGHANACGATVKNKKEIKKLLAVADKNLYDFKLENKDLF